MNHEGLQFCCNRRPAATTSLATAERGQADGLATNRRGKEAATVRRGAVDMSQAPREGPRQVIESLPGLPSARAAKL